MKIFAFQGFRYGASAGEPGLLAAPPFDQIDDSLRDQLQASSPHQFAHLTRPRSEKDEDPYHHATTLHHRWLERGIVERDPRPALYPYVVETASHRRLGLGCLFQVHETPPGELLPHEETVDKPLADRLRLLRAMRVDLEPVFLLCRDHGELDAALARDLEVLPELASHRDTDGNWHRLYRLDDGDRIQEYKTLLSPFAAAIADGHHRSKVAQLFAQETSPPPGHAATAKLAVLTSLASRDLRIDPLHRAVQVPISPQPLLPLALSRQPFTGGGGQELAQAVAQAPPPALGVWFDRQETPEIWRLDARQAPSTTPRGGGDLEVVLLHHLVLPTAGLQAASGRDGSILYRSDPQELYAMVETDRAQAGFWLPPMKPEAFAAAIAQGDLLPPKSTRFLPKLASGLVWAGHDAELA